MRIKRSSTVSDGRFCGLWTSVDRRIGHCSKHGAGNPIQVIYYKYTRSIPRDKDIVHDNMATGHGS